MSQRWKKLILTSTALIIILACSVPPPPPDSPDYAATTSVAATAQAAAQIISATLTAAPVPSETPTPLPPPPTLTPTITLTPTPAIPLASVSVNTNCRTGPGKIYDYIGALMIGEKAEVVGKHSATNYWIIKNPDSIGNCWLWGSYATVVGNTSNLPEYAVPPTPTPSIPNAPTNLAAAKTCVAGVLPNYTITVDLSWTDNATNETGFNIYVDGILKIIHMPNQTQYNFSFAVTDSIPATIGISAFNNTKESSINTIQVVCP